MSVLKTDYKNDVINSEFAADRKFAEIANGDGSYSYNDVTPYTQEGDEYGAEQINFENTHTNYAIEAADRTYEGTDLTVRFAQEIAGYSNVWRWIKARIAAVNFDGLHVGDYIPIYMGSYLMKMQIAGIDTYYRTTPGELGHHIDWISKDCYPQGVQWNTENNNNGTAEITAPYLKSTVKSFLDGLVSKLPTEVQEVISSKTYLLENRYSASGVITNSTYWGWADLGKLWIPSEYEVFGSCAWATMPWGNGQGVQYPIFANSWRSRIKGVNDGGARASWWLLTVCGGVSEYATLVSGEGAIGNILCSDALQVPICFRITE